MALRKPIHKERRENLELQGVAMDSMQGLLLFDTCGCMAWPCCLLRVQQENEQICSEDLRTGNFPRLEWN